MSVELKPCPFCGGEATVERGEIDYMVVCRGCLVGVIHSEIEATPDIVALLWNKRWYEERLEERDYEIVSTLSDMSDEQVQSWIDRLKTKIAAQHESAGDDGRFDGDPAKN